MRAETWYGDQEMVDAGLADEVSGQPSGKNAFDLGVLALYRNTPSDLLPGNKPAPTPAPLTPEKPDLLSGYLAYQRTLARANGVQV
jgi:hypothetical protein